MKSGNFDFLTVSHVVILLLDIPKFVLQCCYRVVASIHVSCFYINITKDPYDRLYRYFLNPFCVICSIFLAQQTISLTYYFCTRILITDDSNILISAEISLILRKSKLHQEN